MILYSANCWQDKSIKLSILEENFNILFRCIMLKSCKTMHIRRLMPVYNQATLMTHPIQPVAGGNWIPSIDETNTTLYRNRSSRSLQQQPNPLYHDDSERYINYLYM